jgi:hypothetical protein
METMAVATDVSTGDERRIARDIGVRILAGVGLTDDHPADDVFRVLRCGDNIDIA